MSSRLNACPAVMVVAWRPFVMFFSPMVVMPAQFVFPAEKLAFNGVEVSNLCRVWAIEACRRMSSLLMNPDSILSRKGLRYKKQADTILRH